MSSCTNVQLPSLSVVTHPAVVDDIIKILVKAVTARDVVEIKLQRGRHPSATPALTFNLTVAFPSRRSAPVNDNSLEVSEIGNTKTPSEMHSHKRTQSDTPKQVLAREGRVEGREPRARRERNIPPPPRETHDEFASTPRRCG